MDWEIRPTVRSSAAEKAIVSIRKTKTDFTRLTLNIISYPYVPPVSVDSITEGDRRALGADIPASSTYSGALSYHYPQQPIRRSLPNMAHSMLVHEPAKIYPYHLLLITNYRLPSDVDRCNLEVSLPHKEKKST